MADACALTDTYALQEVWSVIARHDCSLTLELCGADQEVLRREGWARLVLRWDQGRKGISVHVHPDDLIPGQDEITLRLFRLLVIAMEKDKKGARKGKRGTPGGS